MALAARLRTILFFRVGLCTTAAVLGWNVNSFFVTGLCGGVELAEVVAMEGIFCIRMFILMVGLAGTAVSTIEEILFTLGLEKAGGL